MDRRNNFNLLRLFGACCVLFFHVHPLRTGLAQDPLAAVNMWLNFGILGMRVFFVISGYLLTASLLRNPSLPSFAAARVLRIWPALIGTTLFAMLVLAPAVTRDPAYFARPETWTYLRTMAMFADPSPLPGVFAENPVAVVNGSLWTLPLEVTCYVILGLSFPLLRRARWVSVAVLIVAYGSLFVGTPSSAEILPAVAQANLLEFGSFFCAGVVLRLFSIRGHPALDVLAIAMLACAVAISDADWRPLRLAEIVCLPYLVIRLATASWRPGADLLTRFDLSYGVFLYSFPLTQLAILWLGREAPTAAVAALAAILTLPLAFLSWLVIERPTLGLRDRLRAGSAWRWNPARAPGALRQPAFAPQASGADDR